MLLSVIIAMAQCLVPPMHIFTAMVTLMLALSGPVICITLVMLLSLAVLLRVHRKLYLINYLSIRQLEVFTPTLYEYQIYPQRKTPRVSTKA